jgi:NTP pyrophosphatase (non-canonical NTP hydrolase)
MKMMPDVKGLTEKIKKFRDERDWMQFHGHKEMAISLILEAAEVLEHFQWKSPQEIEEYAKIHKDEIGEEIADVGMYLFELADNLGIDLKEAMEKKLEKNAAKYPIEKAKGKHTKYNKL